MSDIQSCTKIINNLLLRVMNKNRMYTKYKVLRSVVIILIGVYHYFKW